MPRNFKSKPRKTLERLLDSPDEKIALGAARALNLQPREKAARSGGPAWYVSLDTAQQAVFRIVGAVEGKNWNIPLSAQETALAEDLRKARLDQKEMVTSTETATPRT